MKIQYVKPSIDTINTNSCSILTSSAAKTHACNTYCKFWHICRDREWGKICEDFRYKEL